MTRSPRRWASRRKRRKSRERAVGRVDLAVVGDVVPVVAQRGRVEGQEPERGDAEALEVVELLDQAPEVADAVAVAVVEGPHVELVDDGVLVPGRRAGDRSRSSSVLPLAQRSVRRHRRTSDGRAFGWLRAKTWQGTSAGSRLDEVRSPVPHVAGPGQQVVHDVGAVSAEAKRPPGRASTQPDCGVTMIEVDHREHHIEPRSVRSVDSADLGVGDQLVVVGAVERRESLNCRAGCSRRMRFTRRDERGQARRTVEVPGADLVLLGAQVLLGSRRPREVFLQLEGRPVDAVARRQAWRRARGATRKAARPPVLELLGEDVGRVRPQVRPEVGGGVRARSARLRYVSSSHFVVRQVK